MSLSHQSCCFLRLPMRLPHQLQMSPINSYLSAADIAMGDILGSCQRELRSRSVGNLFCMCRMIHRPGHATCSLRAAAPLSMAAVTQPRITYRYSNSGRGKGYTTHHCSPNGHFGEQCVGSMMTSPPSRKIVGGWRSHRAIPRPQAGATPMGAGGDATEFAVQIPTDAGMLEIRPVREEDKGAAGVVLTRAFAGSDDGQSIGNVSEYIETLMSQFPEVLLLIARLTPKDETLLPPGQSSRLIGTVSLSMSPSTREEFPTLQPADDMCYLSNMAVDAKFRRQGIARRLLEVCNEYVKDVAGVSGIQLHVRNGDEPAERLYANCGYGVLEKDGFMVKLRGITPRALMEKRL